ncbi:Hypothetical Protein FCC1311_066842 [Hondaea fermentalgiana]|uniref:Uncharacterized protein n=1 Tax=Hondaea fermentalgiana TaxID=2315210 RepID=A0A2R5GIN4_9STRA|nr:Hypothetical Protein FCC1311_066842 [Hondaea fermentalgiana]|eukprot:GBG30465.1 Hypothetical Protein FCC1311_066842 [Hondaea fermentalgiana]
MDWFESLDYDPERDLRVEMEARVASLRKSTTILKRGGAEPKYLEIPQRYQPPPKKERRRKTSPQSKKPGRPNLAKLPRVATLKPKPSPLHQSPHGTHFSPDNLSTSEDPLSPAKDQIAQARIKEGYLFWRECSLTRALEKSKVDFVPTLVFDMGQRTIRWVCFRETAHDFQSTKDIAPHYAQIVQSLCHFGGSPLVRVRSYEGSKGSSTSDTFCLSKVDLVERIEALCKTFSAPPARAPFGLVVLQAIVPAHFGRLARLSGSRVEKRLMRHCSVGDLEGQIVIEEAESNESLAKPARRRREILYEVRSFRTQSSTLADTKARLLAQKARAVAQEAHKSEADRCREGLQWCIGDVHESATLDTLRNIDPGARQAIVYKLVLAHRYGIEDSSQLAEALPEKLRTRMYETVKSSPVATTTKHEQVPKADDAEQRQEGDIEEKETTLEEKSPGVATPSKVIKFDGISCGSFFGNEVEKLELCQGIMDTLRSGQEACVRAPLEENNGSTEEARLVLRSLYLEFRGMCIDQGYFPDVPVRDNAAVMSLQPLPSYVDYAHQQSLVSR